MEQDDRTLNYPLLSIGDKRPIMDDRDGFHRESKRQCTQPFRYNHDYGTATTSSYIPSSWGAQNGVFDGSVNTLHQPNLDIDLPGHFEQQYAAELPLWSDLPDFGLGYPTHETLSAVIPVQSGEVETRAQGFGFGMENFTDGSPFNTVTQTDSELNIEFLLDGISQEEVAVMEEFNATVFKKEYVHETSKSPSLRDDYATIPPQLAGDSPPKLEDGDKISQERWEPMSQASGIAASEPVGTVDHNEKTSLGQPINVL
jgi:hypothetical protein